MIFRDKDGLLVNSTKDGGDSSVRIALMLLTGMGDPKGFYLYYDKGWCVRHPFQAPWNNRYNYSRDQLICFIAGLNNLCMREAIKDILLATLKRGCFAQNFQRDRVGTWKYPWPHYFTNDRGVQEFSWFDFADPLLPNTIGALIIGARFWPLYWFLPVAYVFHILSVLGSSYHDEQNQIIAEMSFYGKLSFSLYSVVNPDWKKFNHEYWYDRNEGEYADAIEKYVEDKLK